MSNPLAEATAVTVADTTHGVVVRTRRKEDHIRRFVSRRAALFKDQRPVRIRGLHATQVQGRPSPGELAVRTATLRYTGRRGR